MQTQKSHKFYWASLIFGGAPLVFGIFIFVMWVYTRYEFLEMMGFFNIFAGIICVLVAFVCMLVCTVMQIKEKTSLKKLFLKTFLVILIILSNFPAAGAFLGCVSFLVKPYTLYVANHSNSVVDDIMFTGPGDESKIEHMEPNKIFVLHLSFKGQGELKYSFKINAEAPLAGIVDNYVSNGSNGRSSLLRINQNGQIDLFTDFSD